MHGIFGFESLLWWDRSEFCDLFWKERNLRFVEEDKKGLDNAWE